MHFIIELSSGRARNISSLSVMRLENEVLLPPNSRFNVDSVMGPSSDGLLTVQLRELQPIDPIMSFDPIG